MPRKKSPATLDRDINASLGVPAWQRGLDMTESRRLAAQIGSVDPKVKERIIESDRKAALPNVTLRVHQGQSAHSNVPRGVSVDVTNNRTGSRVRGVARVLRSYGLPVQDHFTNSLFVPVPASMDVDLMKASITEALRHAGYRV